MKVLQPEGFIVFSDVTKTFQSGSQSYTAIRDVTLSIRRGDITMLLGPSGCGKSTLLNLTAGLIGPSQGGVTYDGAPVGGLNHRVAYMTQQDHLLPWRTVSGNVSIPLEVAGLAKRDREARLEELLSLVGLGDFAESYPNQISGGMRKRCACAATRGRPGYASARRTVWRARCATQADTSGRTAQDLPQTQFDRHVRDARHRGGGGVGR